MGYSVALVGLYCTITVVGLQYHFDWVIVSLCAWCCSDLAGTVI